MYIEKNDRKVSIIRKERIGLRKHISRILKLENWNISDIFFDMGKHRHRYSQYLRTQISKMYYEDKLKLFKENLAYINHNGVDIPIISCHLDVWTGTWIFICPFCESIHSHISGEGFRKSRCSHFPNGYFLFLMAKSYGFDG